MRKNGSQTISHTIAVAGVTALLIAPASSQQQKARQEQVYTCEAIHKRCVGRSTGREISMCDGYYSEAKRTGQWPAFGQYPAVACRR